MAYRVVKVINGCHYLYEQETYREGGKVRTRSQYIGAVDPVKIKTLKAKGEPLDGALKNTEPETETEETEPVITYTVTEAQPETLPKTRSEKPKPKDKTRPVSKPEKLLNTTKSKSRYETVEKPIKTKPRLRIKAKVERHNISRTALEGEHKRFMRHMERLGLKSDNMGRIMVGVGSKVRCRRQRSRNYIITLPRFKTKKQKGDIGPATRTAFKREYRKALAGTYLDAIKEQQPDYYAGLELHLSKAFEAQNKAISRYLMNSNRKTAEKIGLTLHFMRSKMLSDWTKLNLKSEKLGLADHARRKDWRQDAESMMAEIQQRGWSRTYEKYMDELSRAESLTLRKLTECQKMGMLDRLSGKRRKARRELRRLNSRRKALNEACNKISVLAPLFQSYKDSRFDGRKPFMHEDTWKEKIRRRKARQARRALSGQNFSKKKSRNIDRPRKGWSTGVVRGSAAGPRRGSTLNEG